MRKAQWILPLLVLLLTVLLISAVSAEEAADISAQCSFKASKNSWKNTRLVNGDYLKYWQSGSVKNPYLEIRSDEPMYALYILFRVMPASYEIQHKVDGEWVLLAEGDTRFHHVCYELNGETEIRIIETGTKKAQLIINELYVFGAGELPGWVQRWEETYEKADLLVLVAHADDELLFFAGAIPTYDTELGKRVIVAYLIHCGDTRRSEALDGLWTMGVRHYPVFGPFTDKYSDNLKKAYQLAGKTKVLTWVTALFRKYQPEVVLTQDLKGEYGHGQHRMVADACVQCFDLAADPESDPESAALYGTWEVKKLYIHRYGDKADRLHFEWDTPLENLDGKTGMEAAIAAFEKHKTQYDLYFRIGGYRKPLRVEITGAYYENTDFGLYATRVGPDEEKNDFLEHIDLE